MRGQKVFYTSYPDCPELTLSKGQKTKGLFKLPMLHMGKVFIRAIGSPGVNHDHGLPFL